MLIQDLQNRYTGIHPDFWEELNEYMEFERKRQREFFTTIINEIQVDLHNANSDHIEYMDDYEALLEDYDQLAEECDNLYQTIDELRQKLEEAENVADVRLLEIIKLKTMNKIEDNKIIKFGF